MDYQPDPGLSVEARLLLVERILMRIEERLFGNGQPGELSLMKSRLTALEEFRWKSIGALGVIVVIYEAIKGIK